MLKLIDMAVTAANKAQIPVELCGQMSGNPIYTMLLLGMGLRQMSVAPAAIPEIKKVIRSVSIAQCEVVAKKVMHLENARDVKSYLKDELKRLFPTEES